MKRVLINFYCVSLVDTGIKTHSHLEREPTSQVARIWVGVDHDCNVL